MADYYPLIARAISGLDVNSTGEQRRALYERARSALIAQLRGVQPPLSESDITRERLTLEEAIRKVESEAAARARAAARGEASRPRASDSVRPSSAAAGGLRDRSSPRPERPARDGDSSPPRPRVDDRLFSREPREPREPRDRDRPGLAQRRERNQERPVDRDRSPERPSRDRPTPNGVRGFRDVMADADELGGAAAEANRSARRTYNQVPSPTPEFDRTEPSLEDRTADASFDAPAGRDRDPALAFPDNAPYSYDESPEEAERYAQRQPSPLRPDGPIGRERPPLRTFPVKRIAALGIVLILLGLLVVFWPSLRSMFSDSPSRQRVAETPKQPAASGERPKITDRVGQPSDSPVAPVAQRVVLYDEDPAEPQGKQYVGQVVWRTENVPGTGGQAADLAIRADIEIPERKFKASMSIRRNNDTSLPASHTVEMTFNLPPDFAGGGIANVPGVLMKSNEQTRGTPLAGLAVKVTDNFYLIGLSNVEADRSRNIQLLKERSWFDVPLVYTNQRRAIIALEKGAPGERAFNDAFTVWKQ